jgi:hypothetical protein
MRYALLIAAAAASISLAGCAGQVGGIGFSAAPAPLYGAPRPYYRPAYYSPRPYWRGGGYGGGWHRRGYYRGW